MGGSLDALPADVVKREGYQEREPVVQLEYAVVESLKSVRLQLGVAEPTVVPVHESVAEDQMRDAREASQACGQGELSSSPNE